MASVNYRLDKLQNQNYSTWRTIIKAQLMSKDLWQCVVSEKNENDEDKIRNEEAKHLIYISMEASEIEATCETANDLWNKIKENHEGAESNLQSTALAEFLSLKYQKDESMITFAGRFEIALGRLNSTDYKIDEKIKVWAFSHSLPPHIMNTVNMFKIANKNGKVADLISELKNTYHMENSEMNRGNVAFQARESNSKYKNSKSQAYAQQNPDNGCPKKEYQQIKCTYCHKTNHIRKDGRK